MSRFTWAMYCRLDGWLMKLAEGWRLPWIVDAMAGPHGAYSILLTTDTNPETRSGGALAATPHPAARHTAETAWQRRMCS